MANSTNFEEEEGIDEELEGDNTSLTTRKKGSGKRRAKKVVCCELFYLLHLFFHELPLGSLDSFKPQNF